MSGPKVVRVVTREEAIATSQARLARLDAALAKWEEVGRKNDCVDEVAIARMRARRAEIGALLATDRFTELQKQVPDEEAFLRSDLEFRLAVAAEKRAAQRLHQRRRGEAATALVTELRRSGKPISASLEQGLERADPEAMAAGFQLLGATNTDASSSEAALAQAAKLKDEGVDPGAAFEEWMRLHAPPISDPVTEKLEARLATLAQLEVTSSLPMWEERVAEALAEPEGFRRRMRLDGLEVELGRAISEARALDRAREKLRLLLVEFVTAKFPGIEEYEAVLVSESAPGKIDEAAAKGLAALSAFQTAQAAAGRRAAVLEGLAGLGYEVTEGMSTAWVNDGRVVLRKAAQPEYGVEVAGNGDAGRLQVRAVAFTHGNVGPDAGRDADVETVWCGDVTQLSESLSQAGAQLIIERALAPGATPLKRIEVATDADHRSREAPKPQVRRLP